MADEAARDARVAVLADPKLREHKVMGGMDSFANRSAWPNFFSRLVARLQWNPAAIDLAPDAREWRGAPPQRRGWLPTLLARLSVAGGAGAARPTPLARAGRGGA